MKDLKKFIATTIREYLNENVNIEYYEHGQCELFALALHKTLGYDMYFFIDNNAEFETDDGFDYSDALVHAYCKDKKGNCYDASGLITLNDIENDHADYVNEPEHILVTEKMFNDYIQNGFISNFKITELNKLVTYIKDNVSKPIFKKITEIVENNLTQFDTLSWKDITITFNGHSGMFTNYRVEIPIEAYNEKQVDLNVKEGLFNQVHIGLSEELRGNNLTYKIYKATANSLGHIFSAKARRTNPIMDKIWGKLKNDTDFDVYETDLGHICISKELDPKEKENLLKTFYKITNNYNK